MDSQDALEASSVSVRLASSSRDPGALASSIKILSSNPSCGKRRQMRLMLACNAGMLVCTTHVLHAGLLCDK